ncbi:MAG: DEAD/DEAH box helicase family protein [Clostridia bacterium]|nr:DEAD/DEAH box helicase family protein [Clostridia bacterium]
MKLKFKNQDFQTDAVNAVVDLFSGQEKLTDTFSVESDRISDFIYGTSVANVVRIDNETIEKNMHEVQKRNNLPLSELFEDNTALDKAPHFCIEMETGTGKTYVYTKTIFELNRKYGFKKFIIVVPSVAIREGVNKSFEVTKEHFGMEYDNVPYNQFVYNSAKLNDIREFATSADIQIMIINIDAFKKSENIINRDRDALGGETAISFIQETNPIVIIDEPQSVDNTPKSKEAIASLNPMCVLRYSATHKEKINVLYRLTPVDAYQMGLVKQISVSSNQVSGGFNEAYIKLLSVSNDNGFRARIEIDVKKGDAVKREKVTVKHGEDLFLTSGKRDIYEGYQIAGIDCTPEREHIEFSNTKEVALGKSIGDIDENIIKKAQIKRTIEAHLNKELLYAKMGIKVLSLFFIDKVEKYRHEDGTPGIYAKMFEEAYTELLAKPKYESIKNRFSSDVAKAHNGYFSQDKKGRLKDTKGDTQADDDTYNTIMRDKEWLLSFDCPLRFIFSHSALKEGWDNPNVFQVCTLIDQKSTFTCRQKIGRGLRLCVNQNGERVEDKNINILHVMANESFAEFADTLQHEIETDTGMKFGVLRYSMFTNMLVPHKVEVVWEEDKKEWSIPKAVELNLTEEETKKAIEKAEESCKATIPAEIPPTYTSNESFALDENSNLDTQISTREQTYTQTEPLQTEEPINETPQPIAEPEHPKTAVVTIEKKMTYEETTELFKHFEKADYITSTGKIKDTMKEAIKNGTLDIPEKYEAIENIIESMVINVDKRPPVMNAAKEVSVKLNKQVMLSPEFRELWDKIKQKTTYRVKIDTEKLVENCVKALKELPPIHKARIVSQTADLNIENSGITHTERDMRTTDIYDTYSKLPNIIITISDESLLTPTTIYRIIMESGRAQDFLNDPQTFTEQAIQIIRDNRHALAIDGIRYIKLEGEEYFAQEIFEKEEIIANLDKNAVKVEHSVYNYIVYDSSTIERPFAVALDNDPDVKMFFKIPSKFKIDTPIGTYNPDWAVYMTKNGDEKLYFIVETKGSRNPFDRKGKENLKIHCGKQHFKAIDENIEMHDDTNWGQLKVRL